MFGLTARELRVLRALNTPQKIQDFLERIPVNHEEKGETIMSPRRVMRERKAHCLEASLLAAAAFLVQGKQPLLLDLTSDGTDFEHVVAPFRQFGRWGAISKTNHSVLRYREPVYLGQRELAMSYFHEYFTDNGRKTLRHYAMFDLRRLKRFDWITAEEDLWYISETLDKVKHRPILTPAILRNLRRADPLEREAGKLTQWGPALRNYSASKNRAKRVK